MEESSHVGKTYLFDARHSNGEADEGERNHTDELHGDQRLTQAEGQDRELKMDGSKGFWGFWVVDEIE